MLHFPSPDIGMFGRRQRHARGHRIPVTIARTVVPEDPPVLFDQFDGDEAPIGGCRCCTIREKLQQAVREHARARPISRVTIQTAADILPILRTFVTERALGAEFYVEGDLPETAFGGDTLGIESFALSERAPIRWETFSRFMMTLIALRGADLLHVKGTLDIVGCTGPVEVKFMGHLAARPVELQLWPDENRASRVEFIARGIDEKTVRDLFDSVRALT